MKKVRFESPIKSFKMNSINDSECHSPRPYIGRHLQSAPQIHNLEYRVPYTNDLIQRFECGNSSPYPIVSKTCLASGSKVENKWSPSNELDLSILDSSYDSKNRLKTSTSVAHDMKSVFKINQNPLSEDRLPLRSSHAENIKLNPPNILIKNDEFFLRKDNLQGFKTLHSQINKLHLGKENNPMLKKTEMMSLGASKTQLTSPSNLQAPCCPSYIDNSGCRCHHCIKVCHMQHHTQHTQQPVHTTGKSGPEHNYNVCQCIANLPQTHLQHSCNANYKHVPPTCSCNPSTETFQSPIPQPPLNAVDKKTWAIEKYGQINKTECQEVQKQSGITKEKREPTVADLFKIIKLQNEQLQLLQEKVDKFISVNRNEAQKMAQPAQNYVTEHVALESMETLATKQKISIGVMTSFEMVRTSTIINKEIVTQNEAQIQCNRSQISIKEVVSKQPVNQNFLDGIKPVSNNQAQSVQSGKHYEKLENGDLTRNTDHAQDEKTLNEMSLYNVQVDNAITPDLSPEPSLYLDVRDYSDSDASSDDQSNVGWTYYNKVMTHVNGMLQDSDMPSSASALYRNARQKCLQMQIDKTNISVAKRVTFGDDVALQQQMQILNPSTDTSLKMNQLAAKYLKNAPVLPSNPRSPKAAADMSLATRNYMEKHNILQGKHYSRSQPQVEIPKFLDITALKQQPKFL